MADDEQSFRPGERVAWNSHGSKNGQGRAEGRIVRKLTEPTDVGGHEAKASPDEPQYLVESDNGGRAAHHPSALRRIGDGDGDGS